jgi:predicted MFS family arabinose efflux permease
LGTGVAGSFGLLGAVGAVVASLAGRLADRHGTRFTLTLALGLLSVGYVLLWVFGYDLAGLIVGVIVLDAGQQGMQISNQTRIFALSSTARSRINTVYMIIFFMGGALGSALSAAAWSRWQWSGVCAWGLAMLVLAWVRHGYGYADHAASARP